MTLEENLALQSYYCKPLSENNILKYDAFEENATRLIEEYDVRTQSQKIQRGRSGGNQQKLIIAREVDGIGFINCSSANVVWTSERVFIHKRLIEQRDRQ